MSAERRNAKFEFLIGKTIKSVHFAGGEAGFLVQFELSFTDGMCATLMLDEPKLPIKLSILSAQIDLQDEVIPRDIKL